jgi:hypothetical protein
VQDRVLDPADILFHRQPLLDHFRIERTIGGLAGKAQEIPRAVDEGVERVGFAPRGVAALRAIDMLPGGMAIERIARHREIDIVGQRDRQVLLGHRHHAADFAMHEGIGVPQ